MNLFGLVIAIVYVFIISKIHEWVCKATRKDQYFFSLYIFLIPLVLEIILYFLKLDSFSLSKFLFPFLSSYLVTLLDLRSMRNLREFLSVYYFLFYIIVLITFYQ